MKLLAMLASAIGMGARGAFHKEFFRRPERRPSKQTWRSFKTPDGWKLEFEPSLMPVIPGRRWARKNRRWHGGDNPKHYGNTVRGY